MVGTCSTPAASCPAYEKQRGRGRTWKLYWSDESVGGIDLFGDGETPDADGSTNASARADMIEKVSRFLSVLDVVGHAVRDPADVVAQGHTLHLPFGSLCERPFGNDHSDFEPLFPKTAMGGPFDVKRPALLMDCLAYLAHESLLDRCPAPSTDTEHTAVRLAARRLRVRVYDKDSKYFLYTPFAELKADKIGRLVALKGSVIRASSLRPYVEKMTFSCPKCSAEIELPMGDGRYKPPDGCPKGECRAKQMVPKLSSAVTRDFQKVCVQENPDELIADLYGRVPRSVEVELLDDLVDACVPGDVIRVVGIVKAVEVSTDAGGPFGRGGSSKPKTMYLLYLEALAIQNTKAAAIPGTQPRGAEGADGGALDGGSTQANGTAADANDAAAQHGASSFSVRDLQEISRLHTQWDGRLFELMAASMCPSIFGHEVVKLGLCLGLFGGSLHAATATGIPKRPDIHVLVVGDPGMGKSQMLTAASVLAPRGVYVCGNATSSSGLTVTVVKDSNTGDFTLEAGALVMGDQGCCCIDEFDKMSGSEHQALLEAMEHQSISVAKAGIVCTLSARTAVLAAANPVSGHYNRQRTVAENLKLPLNILSRFDLVFVILDRPDSQMDKLLSKHVMALHAGAAKQPAAARRNEGGGGGVGGGGANDPFSGSGGVEQWRASQTVGASLAHRLRESAAALRGDQLLTPTALRKFIAYARAHVHPMLTEAAKEVIRHFYCSRLRANQRGGDSVPVTARQLESLVRLSEARARMDLREEVTASDARDAVAVVEETILCDTLADLVGTGIFGGAGGSQRPTQPGGGGGGAAAGASRRSYPKAKADFISFLEGQCLKSHPDRMFTRDELFNYFNCSGIGCPKGSVHDFIEKLNHEAVFLLKAGQKYQLQRNV